MGVESGFLPQLAKKMNLPGTQDLQSGPAAQNQANRAAYDQRYGSLGGIAGGAAEKGVGALGKLVKKVI